MREHCHYVQRLVKRKLSVRGLEAHYELTYDLSDLGEHAHIGEGLRRNLTLEQQILMR